MAADELDREDRPTGDVGTPALEHEDEPLDSDEPWPQLSPLELSVCLADAAWGATGQRRSPAA